MTVTAPRLARQLTAPNVANQPTDMNVLRQPSTCTNLERQRPVLCCRDIGADDDKAPGDPLLHGMFGAAVRTYVKPGSERGPDSNLQLRPHVLTFYFQ